MNDFASDDKFQREKRDKWLWPWYGNFAKPTAVDADKEFQKLGIDTVLVYRKNGHVLNVEEKIVRWPGYQYEAFALETQSCTLQGMESNGWMVYGKADRLLYCFAQDPDGLDCYWIDFPQLQKWFWPRESEFSVFQMDQKNRTRGRVVPIADVLAAVETRHFRLA